MNQHSGSATLPRGFRFEMPRTPEPFAENDEAQIPSPPKPRLRLVKRRVVSQLTAPTQQFLASVAAADVPIPSIEEPETSSHDFAMGNADSFPARMRHEEMDASFLQPIGRTYELPKTPAPDFIPCLSPGQYPNWTLDSTASSVESTPEPDYESSRPSTARSTLTSASLFSRFSMLSDDDNCASPLLESKEHYRQEEPELPPAAQPSAAAGKAKARKAPWTKAMSDHLWSTFILYLQDPKVTPFRMGKSCLPPDGVCLRVAREAKRSWKGAKALTKKTNVSDGRKSGSTTPTAENSSTFIQWPHTCAATRVHLRELCRQKAAAGAKNPRFLPRSTTPFAQAAARHSNMRPAPAHEPLQFATKDMSLSLALSTAESMQPTGPLAQLTGSTPEPVEEEQSNATEPFPLAPAFDMPIISPNIETYEGGPGFAGRQRLGSPFGAKSYGPSSSGSLATVLGLSGPMPRRQSQTLGSRRTLQSPVRMSRSGTQKRRHTQSSVPRVRPSIGADLWLDPNFSMNSTGDARADREFCSTASSHHDELFIPRIPPVPTLSSSTSMPNVGGQLLEPPALQPPRLGSPFKGHRATRSSFSFPSRMHRAQSGSVDLGMLGRPFATIQQPSTESSTSPVRSNLAGRLAYLDQRLKEIRQREANRRSQSPL